MNEFSRATRARLKRALLDASTSACFDLPSGMVEAEFKQIWAQVEQDLKSGNMAEEDKGKSEDELKSVFATRLQSAAFAWGWSCPSMGQFEQRPGHPGKS